MTQTPLLTRAPILRALQDTLEPLDHVLAMWEGGSAAFGIADEWSDIDLQIAVKDGRTDETIPIVESILKKLSPIELRYEVPRPAWHGHWQAFYRLEKTSPYLLFDFVIMEESNPNKFLEPEIHAERIVYFDKTGVTEGHPLDKAAHLEKIRKRLEVLPVLFEMFQVMITKNFPRGSKIEAAGFYHALTLRPLVELLKIKHCPTRFDWGPASRTTADLPPDVITRLEPLFFPGDIQELEMRHAEAVAYFREVIESIDLDEVARLLETM